MKYKIRILRQKEKNKDPFWEEFEFETDESNMAISTVLLEINKGLEDERKIFFEHSCLQKKCGACAMVINQKPSLACAAKIGDYKKGVITIEPLRKFPVIKDLVVDRSILKKNLLETDAFIKDYASFDKKNTVEDSYESLKCLQCGLCLEVCPSFNHDGDFYGTAFLVPLSRMFIQEDDEKRAKDYKTHIYDKCAKSLSCRNICPMKINIDNLLARSNKIAIWRKHAKSH